MTNVSDIYQHLLQRREDLEREIKDRQRTLSDTAASLAAIEALLGEVQKLKEEGPCKAEGCEAC